MKSIKQQYIDLKEGKMSQANFMRNVRMSLPQYITNVTSFNDTVKILKNKGILNEANLNNKISEDPVGQQAAGNPEEEAELRSTLVKSKTEAREPSEYASFYEDPRLVSMGQYEDRIESIDKEIEKLNKKYPGLYDWFNNNDPENIVDSILKIRYNSELPSYDIAIKVLDKYEEYLADQEEEEMQDYFFDVDTEEDDIPYDPGNIDDYNDGEFWEAKDGGNDDEILAMIDKIEKEKEGEEAVKSQYDLFEIKNRITADKAHPQELRMGIKVEMEHTDDLKKAEKIALDHLTENPFYYTQLKLSGVDTQAKPNKEKKAIAKKKNETEFVDKANQMKPVKGIDKPKKDAKAHKETNKPVSGISLMSLVAKTVRGVKKMEATGEKMKKVKLKEELELTEDHLHTREEQIEYIIKSGVYAGNKDYLNKQTDEKIKQIYDRVEKEVKGGNVGSSFQKFKDQLKEMIRKELTKS